MCAASGRSSNADQHRINFVRRSSPHSTSSLAFRAGLDRQKSCRLTHGAPRRISRQKRLLLLGRRPGRISPATRGRSTARRCLRSGRRVGSRSRTRRRIRSRFRRRTRSRIGSRTRSRIWSWHAGRLRLWRQGPADRWAAWIWISLALMIVMPVAVSSNNNGVNCVVDPNRLYTSMAAVSLSMGKSAARNKNAQNAGERQSSQHCTKKSQTAHYVPHWLSAGFLPQLIDSKLLRDSSEIDFVRGHLNSARGLR
jgi:hypothetical protein